MSDPAQALKEFRPAKEFFIGIDSDGCVFDSMEIKHKECFTPMFIKHFHLQAVSRYAREVWDFVNLYSKSRGTNRFPALSLSLNLLRERPQVLARKVAVPDTTALDEWTARETRLGNATLAAEVKNGNHKLLPVKEWSDAVNRAVEEIVHGVPPFPLFRESLEKIGQRADAMVISQTPAEALEREWSEHGIISGVRLIAGQEMGTKTEHLKFAAAGKYAPEKILMIGDAPGDYKAAKASNALFYPIVPGNEERSWQRFHGEALGRFFSGRFAGSYAEELLREFEDSLPDQPHWQ
ncbi:MAG: HAD family hydrolase [Verrucomicrobiota bacterium]|nr:HAD family hydrolase [Verrucomicrobiota bacterium]